MWRCAVGILLRASTTQKSTGPRATNAPFMGAVYAADNDLREAALQIAASRASACTHSREGRVSYTTEVSTTNYLRILRHFLSTPLALWRHSRRACCDGWAWVCVKPRHDDLYAVIDGCDNIVRAKHNEDLRRDRVTGACAVRSTCTVCWMRAVLWCDEG